MNILECGALAIAFTVIILSLKKLGLSWEKALLFGCFTLPGLYFSVSEVTQFLTTDEIYLIIGPTYIEGSDLKAWQMGFFKTSYLVLVPILEFIRSFTSAGDHLLKGWAKLLHWATGFGAFLLIEHYISVQCTD